MKRREYYPLVYVFWLKSDDNTKIKYKIQSLKYYITTSCEASSHKFFNYQNTTSIAWLDSWLIDLFPTLTFHLQHFSSTNS